MAKVVEVNTDTELVITSKTKEMEFSKRLYVSKPYTLDIYIETLDGDASIYLSAPAVAALREWLNRGID